jgi:RHS repeat-associated protein
VNITYTFTSGNITNTKFSAYITSGSSGNVRYNQERQNDTFQHFKHDSGNFTATGNYQDGNTITVLVSINLTSNLTKACVVGGSCSSNDPVGSFTPGDFVTIAPGTMIAKFNLNVTNIVVYNTGTATSTTSSATQDFVYVHADGQLVAQKNPDGTKYYISDDNKGSTNVVTDGSGSLVEHDTYSPFGELLNTSVLKFGYEGKEADTLVGDTDFHARKYNPSWGIFTQPDTVIQNVYDPQQLNRYSFERNNPYAHTDTSGHCVEDGCLGEAAIVIAYTAVELPAVFDTAALGIDTAAYIRNNVQNGDPTLNPDLENKIRWGIAGAAWDQIKLPGYINPGYYEASLFSGYNNLKDAGRDYDNIKNAIAAKNNPSKAVIQDTADQAKLTGRALTAQRAQQDHASHVLRQQLNFGAQGNRGSGVSFDEVVNPKTDTFTTFVMSIGSAAFVQKAKLGGLI